MRKVERATLVSTPFKKKKSGRKLCSTRAAAGLSPISAPAIDGFARSVKGIKKTCVKKAPINYTCGVPNGCWKTTNVWGMAQVTI
jgi:hypothetical protein